MARDRRRSVISLRFKIGFTADGDEKEKSKVVVEITTVSTYVLDELLDDLWPNNTHAHAYENNARIHKT